MRGVALLLTWLLLLLLLRVGSRVSRCCPRCSLVDLDGAAISEEEEHSGEALFKKRCALRPRQLVDRVRASEASARHLGALSRNINQQVFARPGLFKRYFEARRPLVIEGWARDHQLPKALLHREFGHVQVSHSLVEYK